MLLMTQLFSLSQQLWRRKAYTCLLWTSGTLGCSLENNEFPHESQINHKTVFSQCRLVDAFVGALYDILSCLLRLSPLGVSAVRCHPERWWIVWMHCDPSLRSHIITNLQENLRQTENHKLPSHNWPNTVILRFPFTDDKHSAPIIRFLQKNTHLSSGCPLLSNFERITLSVLFVCVGDSRRSALFWNTKAVCWSTRLVNLVSDVRGRLCVCGCVVRRGHTQNMNMQSVHENVFVCMGKQQGSGCLCDKITEYSCGGFT